MEGATPFDDGTEITLYEGKCRKYINAAKYNEVIISTYGLSIPGTVPNIKVGDLLNVIDPSGEFDGRVVRSNPGNLGTTVFFDITGQ